MLQLKNLKVTCDMLVWEKHTLEKYTWEIYTVEIYTLPKFTLGNRNLKAVGHSFQKMYDTPWSNNAL